MICRKRCQGQKAWMNRKLRLYSPIRVYEVKLNNTLNISQTQTSTDSMVIFITSI